MDLALLSPQTVVRATGLSAHVLRAWEKRYGAVRPSRSRSGQRRYTPTDVQRLLLLRRATQAGHPIGTIASQSDAAIRRLLAGQTTATAAPGSPEQQLRAECIAAIRSMDQPSLIRALDTAVVRLGHQGLLRRIVAPLAEEIGSRWRNGDITAAHEHFFTAGVRSFLGNVAQQFAPAGDAPPLVAATPAGQYHELGAFMAAVTATHLGWRAIYLGSSLPAAEIAAAVIQLDAPVVVLSIIHPPDDRHLAAELRALRHRLPKVHLLVGGRAAESYGSVLKSIKARVILDLDQLGDELDSIRARAHSAEDRSGNARGFEQ